MGNNLNAKKITSGLAWSFAERISAQLVSTVVSIILARLLEPEHYGIISIVMIFISICNIFVSDGFGKALVQKKEADKLDFDSMFWLGWSTSVALYLILFLFAPAIGRFYNMDMLPAVIRVMGFQLILNSLNAIQQAYVQRCMEFKKFFIATSFGTAVSAVVGIFMAYRGYGVWALVAQYLTNTTIGTVVLFFICGWRPGFHFSSCRVKIMLPFTVNVLAQSIVFTAEDNFRSLIVGKRFGSADLAFYNRGNQFPQLIITSLNSAIMKVMLPTLAKNQDNLESCKSVTRKAISVGMYLLCPAMIGFCAIGDTFVSVLLTDKWLPAVPFLRIFCIAYLMRPFEYTSSSALLAIGRSDITLNNMIIVNITALATVFIAVFGFESVFLIAVGTLVSAAVSVCLYSYYMQKCLGYMIREQFEDCLPFILASSSMAVFVWFIHYIPIYKPVVMLMQIIGGTAFYILVSKIFKIKEFDLVCNNIKKFLKRESAQK